MIKLRNHYRGEGNQTRRVTDAETLRDTLHYKSEGALPFGTFLSRVQHMFNLFEQAGEEYTEAMKLRFLTDKVQSTILQPVVQAIKATNAVVPGSYDFTSAANHLAAAIKPKSKLGLSQVQVDPSRAEIMKDGKIFTGYYQNWHTISAENQKLVIAERSKLGIEPKKRKRGGRGAKNLKSQVKALVTRQIAAIRASAKSARSDDDSSHSDSSSDGDRDNAGDAFGGRAEKEKANKKRAKRKKKKKSRG